jgi:branched-chain amino acid transport system ATP-binding protein
MLEVEEIHTYYGEAHILHGVSLSVPQGRLVCILGRNGMGKTTLVRSIAGLTPPRRGRVMIDGDEITGLAPYLVARKGISLVPQGRRIFPSLTVRENLQLAERGKGGPWTIARVLECFPRLGERLRHRGNQLSGGEQQMLAIARALVANPKVLLMDEPSEGLAPLVVAELASIIRGLKEEGQTILMVEQRLRFALDVADEVLIMSKGEVVYRGLPAELESNRQVQNAYLTIQAEASGSGSLG